MLMGRRAKYDMWQAQLQLTILQGVTRGYLRYLRIQGIGFRAALRDQTLTLKLGYSHDLEYTLPPTLKAILPEPTLVGIYGIDKHLVSSICIPCFGEGVSIGCSARPTFNVQLIPVETIEKSWAK